MRKLEPFRKGEKRPVSAGRLTGYGEIQRQVEEEKQID
jgi:hypothetical protein